jgi:hypothetical protein
VPYLGSNALCITSQRFHLTMLVPDIFPAAHTSAPAFELTEDKMLPPCSKQRSIASSQQHAQLWQQYVASQVASQNMVMQVIC